MDIFSRFSDQALITAIEEGRVDRVRTLLQQGANPNTLTGDGWSALLTAARGPASIVRLLVDHGADPNVATSRGYTPLMRAAGHGADEIVGILLEAGADLSPVDNEGQSALDIAYSMRFPQTAKILEAALKFAQPTEEAALAP